MKKVQHKKKESSSTTAIIVVVGILVAAGFFAFSGENGSTSETQTNFDTDALAQCIIDSGAIFYGTEWCSHCQNQKTLLGDTFNQYRSQFYVDCDQDQDACLAAGIQGYPTWVINGERLTGTQPIQRIAQATSCSIEL